MAIGAIAGGITAGIDFASDLFGGGGDKYAGQQGTDLVYSPSQVAEALQRNSRIRSRIIEIMRTDPDVGGEVERQFGSLSSVISNSRTLAQAALHEASLPGRDANTGEIAIRNLVTELMGDPLSSGTRSEETGFTDDVRDFFGDVERVGREGQAAVSGAEAGVATERARASAGQFGNFIPILAIGVVAFFVGRG